MRRNLRLASSFLVLFLFACNAIQANEEASVDSLENEYPKKIRSRSTFETIAYIPGAVIHAPIRFTLYAVCKTTGYVYDTKLIERVTDILSSDDGFRALQPTYSSLTGAGFNIYQKTLLNGKNADVLDKATVTAGIWKDALQTYKFSWSDINIAGQKAFAHFEGYYSKYPDEDLYGIGPYSHDDDEVDFGLETSRFKMRLEHSIGRYSKSYIDIATHYNRIYDTEDEAFKGSIYTEYSNIAGVFERGNVFFLSNGYAIDSKNRPGNPTRGIEGEICGSLFGDATGNRWGFLKIQSDFKFYQHIIYGRVLVFRGGFEINRAFDNREIPFYYLSELGYRETIRGYDRNRFLGRDKWQTSVEYRFPLRNIWDESGFDFTLFFDAGQVSQRDFFADSRLKDIHYGFGGGFRIWNLEGLPAKIEIAKSEEEIRIYFVLNAE